VWVVALENLQNIDDLIEVAVVVEIVDPFLVQFLSENRSCWRSGDGQF
jgi:hypothetical protein